jgi:hypothetical protein
MSKIETKSQDLSVDYHELVDIFNGSNHLVLKPNKHLNVNKKQEYLYPKENHLLPVMGEPLQIPLNIHGENYNNEIIENIQLQEHQKNIQPPKLKENNKKKDILNDIFDELKEEKKTNFENSKTISVNNSNLNADFKKITKNIALTNESNKMPTKIEIKNDSKNKILPNSKNLSVNNEAQKLIKKTIINKDSKKLTNITKKQTESKITPLVNISNIKETNQLNKNSQINQTIQKPISIPIPKPQPKQAPAPTFLTVAPTSSEDDFEI